MFNIPFSRATHRFITGAAIGRVSAQDLGPSRLGDLSETRYEEE